MTKAEIVSALNARLNRSETEASLATEITSALRYISQKACWPCLYTSSSVSLVATDSHIDYPTDYRKLDAIILNDGSQDYLPLEETDFDDILNYRANTSHSGQPDSYCERGGKFELDADCDDSYTATIYFWRYHPDQATILFGDEFTEAVYNAVMFKYLEAKKQLTSAGYYRQIADDEIKKLLPTEDKKPLTVKYRDMG